MCGGREARVSKRKTFKAKKLASVCGQPAKPAPRCSDNFPNERGDAENAKQRRVSDEGF